MTNCLYWLKPKSYPAIPLIAILLGSIPILVHSYSLTKPMILRRVVGNPLDKHCLGIVVE